MKKNNPVGILLITHSGIGAELLKTAKDTFGKLPSALKLISVQPMHDPDDLTEQASALLEALDLGSGVLVLTDLYGATPSNIALHFYKEASHRVRVVAGLNLPMLFRVLNYSDLGLELLAEKAYCGGRDGIVQLPAEISMPATVE